MPREIITIDEEKCDGCGLCIPACHEGALELVNGKIQLVAEKLCDGLGDCLGECPQGALKVEAREADAFDEVAVAARMREIQHQGGNGPSTGKVPAACPSSQFVQLDQNKLAAGDSCISMPSESALTHWPVQLRLLPPTAPAFRGANLLLSADCVPVAFPAFHQELLKGKAVAVACPKLDDSRGYVEKLTEIIRCNDLQGITVAHMQVPCCSGLLMMVLQARRSSGKNLPVLDIVIGTQGEVLARRGVPEEVAV
jgi:NAD-dependent dihydropyrimidine dehydrogenase PreA subunit